MVNLPLKPGVTAYNVTAWTGNQYKSPVKSLLMKFTCEEPPAPPTLAAPLTRNVLAPKTTTITTPTQGLQLLSKLEVRSLRVDVGLPDANAVEWFKGQPTQREILFHEAIGAEYEKGGSKWGVVEAVNVNGQTFQSRGIDSCTSALKIGKYVVGARNSGASYPGTSTNDLKATTSGPSGNFTSTGKVGQVATNAESASTIDASSQGIILFLSGTYAVKTELLPPAAGATAENNAAQLSLAFKCKQLNATTWQ
jgi:hypothetical protein